MNNSFKTILLVEDEVLIAMAEERQLLNAGYNVVTVFSGEEAVALVKKGIPRIDIVLMDIDLGRGKDGTQAALEILEFNDIPILFQSSHTEKDIVEKTEKITSYGYVVKHSGITILDASIKMAFRLHRAYLELKEKEENLLIKERAIESSINAIAMSDAGGILFYVNPSFLSLWGYDTDAEVIGHSALDFWEDADTATCIIDSLHSIGGWRGEMIARKRDGTTFDAEVSASIIYGQNGKSAGMIAAFQDITERKISEVKIKESRESFRVIVENVNSLICETDADAKYMYLSPACLRITGYEPEELYGKHIFDFIHPDDLKTLSLKYENMQLSGKTSHDIWRFLHRDGNWRWMDSSSAFYEKTPGNIRAVIICTDITERITEGKKMARMLRDNDDYLADLRQRVTSNVGIVRGFVDFLKSNFAEDVSKKIFLKAEPRIWFLLNIYEHLHVSPAPHGVNLYGYINDILNSIEKLHEIDTGNVAIAKRFNEVTLDVKWVLPVGIILYELLCNALRHAYAGMEIGVVNVSYLINGSELTLCVSDNGSGFDRKYFDSRELGECLGFKLIRGILSQIAGKLVIENNSGSAFYVSINI